MFCPECEEDYPSIHTVCPVCRTDLERPATVTARQIRNLLSLAAGGVAIAIPVFGLPLGWVALVVVLGSMAVVIQLLFSIDDD
jgi:hypothetical protein